MSSTDASLPVAGSRTPRILLIDTLRGVALLAMASYHFTWDLEFFGYLEAGTATHGAWKIYARVIASSFLFLVGVSLLLAHGSGVRWQAFGKRLAMVAGAALVISIATRFAMPEEWIYFGILHNIALSSLIGLAFLRLPPLLTGLLSLVIAGLMVLNNWVAPGILDSEIFNTRMLAWIGFADTMPRSNDYVPVFPWIAAVLAGIAVAGLLRKHGGFVRLASLQGKANRLTWLGRHSLVFYLVHQPVLIGLVYLATLVAPPPAPDPLASFTRSCERSCLDDGNDAGLCTRFCGCTAERVVSQSLFQPMLNGTLDAAGQEKVRSIAQECTAISR
ncbi:Uncharacterized membrane protein [Rhizobium sp. RU35A]|uniref:heparan-alpha-glucosaminide N-acetyltransferase n=1 Tax=Rhizobium TaxID=379 RepID=UPI000956B5F5|nr:MULTISPECIES: DUF1624 domain-containing protein [Rhizobium]SIQ76762.1 Uncharacterized membrane protein [Rhizobium sp. RU35A]